MTASSAERSRISRHRAQQLERVKQQIQTLRILMRQPFVRDHIERSDVSEWLDALWEAAGGLEE